MALSEQVYGLGLGPYLASLGYVGPDLVLNPDRQSVTLRNWAGPTLPTPAEVEAAAEQLRATAQQAAEAKANRRAALQALRDGTGDLTARQLTIVLRILAKEFLDT